MHGQWVKVTGEGPVIATGREAGRPEPGDEE